MATAKTMMRGVGTLLGLGMGFSLGCLSVRLDLNHCANLDGNRTCSDRYPGERTFCTACGTTPGKDGCVAQRPEPDTCYSPCGDESRFEDDATCLVGASSSSGDEESTTTGEETTGTESESSESTTGPMPCLDSEDCMDAGAPFCEPVAGECVGCDGMSEPDAACAGVDAGMPLCVGGACVQCTAAVPDVCVGETPVCDDATNACVPCTAHDQCGAAACNLFTGACLPGDAVVHVGPMQDFATLTLAVASFAAGAEGTIVVHQADYNEAVTVGGGRVVAFLANAADTPLWILAGGGSPQLTVGSDSTVLIDGLRLSGNSSLMHPGVRTDGGRVWVDRGRIVDNNGGGIVAEAGAELVLRNCFVGGSVDDRAALAINAATASILYTSAGAGFGTSTALACDGAATVEVRNSLLVARTDASEVQCSGADIERTVTEMSLGGTNTAVGAMETTWFAGYGNGDFHLLPAAPITIATTARWEDGDPPTDIDGDARPQLDGATDVAGADVP